MTPQELNKALVVEFTRLGKDRTPIDKAMADMGASSVDQVPTGRYQELLDNIRAVQP